MTGAAGKAGASRSRGERCGVGSAPSRLHRNAAGPLAAAFDAFAHPVRLQLLDVIARNEGRACVCDLEAAVPVKQPTVSHHLRLLREAGVVSSEKRGVWAYYSLNREALSELTARVTRFLEGLPS